MMKRECINCKYYKGGECYYNPPVPVFDTYAYKIYSCRPKVGANDLCSKWELNVKKEIS